MKWNPVFFSILAFVQILGIAAKADVLPPPPVAMVGSSDGSHLVRFDSKLKVFSVSKDDKAYQLISEFDSLWPGSVQKMQISNSGNYIGTFETPESSSVNSREEVICIYSSKGKRLKKWRLTEVLEKDDLVKLSPYAGRSLWWYHEVGMCNTPEEIFITGPTETSEKDMYMYALNLEKMIWTKIR